MFLRENLNFFFHKEVLSHCVWEIIHGKNVGLLKRKEEKLKNVMWSFILFWT
jgi:RsiW-degrading membrane proteinase PrsW (M82 family)